MRAIGEIRKSLIISTMSISLNRRKHVLFYQRIGRAGRTGLSRKCRRTHDYNRVWVTGHEREESSLLMELQSRVMKASVNLASNENKSRSGLTDWRCCIGGSPLSSKTEKLCPYTILSAAILSQSNEHNPKMGLVCATPTTGSAGCQPAVLTAAIEN